MQVWMQILDVRAIKILIKGYADLAEKGHIFIFLIYFVG